MRDGGIGYHIPFGQWPEELKKVFRFTMDAATLSTTRRSPGCPKVTANRPPRCRSSSRSITIRRTPNGAVSHAQELGSRRLPSSHQSRPTAFMVPAGLCSSDWPAPSRWTTATHRDQRGVSSSLTTPSKRPIFGARPALWARPPRTRHPARSSRHARLRRRRDHARARGSPSTPATKVRAGWLPPPRNSRGVGRDSR